MMMSERTATTAGGLRSPRLSRTPQSDHPQARPPATQLKVVYGINNWMKIMLYGSNAW